MISVLWHCYLISNSGTQLEVAEMLGVSDSLVSDYRKTDRIESSAAFIHRRKRGAAV